jgi:hypothetical protein
LIIKQRNKKKEGRAVEKLTGKQAAAFESMCKFPDRSHDVTNVKSLGSMESLQKAADLHRFNRPQAANFDKTLNKLSANLNENSFAQD